jgi:predicted NBD/HSP70 family sugar kinase
VREAVEAGKATALARAVDGTEPLTLAGVADAAQDGDAVALDIVARAGRALGLGLSYLVNLFNPQLIMLSGEGARAGEALIGPARETMRKNVFSDLQQDLLVVEPVGDEAWARGAACVVLSELFKHPLHKGEGDRELSLSSA